MGRFLRFQYFHAAVSVRRALDEVPLTNHSLVFFEGSSGLCHVGLSPVDHYCDGKKKKKKKKDFDGSELTVASL